MIDLYTQTILIVDDTPANIALLWHLLEQEGYRVLVAESGERALLQTQIVQPDLILLDVQMPGLDGFATCQRLKEDPATAAIPIIFLTEG